MGWTREFIEKVREGTDLTDVARDYGETKNAGPGKVKMNCPLPNHAEKTPSHYVQKEFFKCFGCGVGGDIFKFIEILENCDFNESVKRLAGKAGISPGPEDWIGGPSGEDKRKDVFLALEIAARIYHQRLLDMDNKAAQQARKYLRNRNIAGEEAKKYAIGYSFPRAKGLSDGLVKKLGEELHAHYEKSGIKKAEIPLKIESILKRAGLISEYEGHATDFFFGERIMFTIFDATDRPIAFSGRQLPNGRDPKYRNSPGTEIYKKDETLYGLNWSKKHIAKEDRIVICEGQLDVIAFHESSLPIAVAPCGTSMTENQVKKLVRYTNNFFLCFDSDKAGLNAAKRFAQWEEKYSLQIKVVTLPEGSDPGDYHSQNKLDQLVKTTEEAVPFLRWRINLTIDEEETETIEERVQAANHSLQIVKDHPEEMYHDDYVRYIGERLDLPYSDLRKKFDKLGRTPKRKQVREQDLGLGNKGQAVSGKRGKLKPITQESKQSTVLSLTVLTTILHNRQTLEQGNILPSKLHAMFFPTPALSKIFEALLSSQNLDQALEKIEGTDEELSIVSELRRSNPNDLINAESASKRVGELLVRRIENELDVLHKRAEESGDLKLIRGLGDVHNAKNEMQGDGYNLFSSEADFLIEWLHERLEN
ncbi:MAG: DNA primase [Acidimicrobiales bacterium]|jgi:DNA primase|nr:DNA primase [Acidimicrobiales bacterium]MDP6298490.1 DNA primase [Acidimicrobiales bacterium]HJM27478.1 DNA primase [Acidimicrobiales bacterium]HJM98570.1 DNA primase [Acidimicrobiales bacterium]